MIKTNRREQGYTLLESVIVLAIMFVVMGVAVVQSFGTLESYQANSGMDVVISQMRVARQVAISQRRTVQLWVDTTFSGPGGRQQIRYQIQPAAQTNEVAGPMVSIPLPGQIQFFVEPGVPDTPMLFGNSAPVYIGGASGGPAIMQFNPTGTFTDNTGTTVLNGTIFLGIPGQATTARAVTIMGGTGRVRSYTYIGTSGGWIE